MRRILRVGRRFTLLGTLNDLPPSRPDAREGALGIADTGVKRKMLGACRAIASRRVRRSETRQHRSTTTHPSELTPPSMAFARKVMELRPWAL